MTEVGVVPTAVTGVEARFLSPCKVQVGTLRMSLLTLTRPRPHP